MFCVDCGKEKPIFREGSCLECYLKHHQFTKGPSVFHIPLCTYCNAYKYKNTWKHVDFETVVKQYIKQSFVIDPELRNVQIQLDNHKEEDIVFTKVTISGLLDDAQISEDHFVEIRLKSNVCDICSKQFGGYHEAILQIRAGKRKLSKEIRNTIQCFVEDLIQDIQDKGNRNLFIADMGVEHGGLDFFLSDKQAAYTITKKVQEEFGGDIHVSSKNVGMKDGKQLYRYTYLLRLLPFQKEDVFKLQDNYYFVLNISSNKLHIIKLEDYSGSFVTSSDVEQGLLIASAKDLSFKAILISETLSELQLMHPTSYAIFTIKKPDETFKYTDTTEILQINEYYFVKPVKDSK